MSTYEYDSFAEEFLEVDLNTSRENVQCVCVNCGKRKAYFHRRKGLYYCHSASCNYRANITQLIQFVLGVSYEEALFRAERMSRSLLIKPVDEEAEESMQYRIISKIMGLGNTGDFTPSPSKVSLPTGCVPIAGTRGESYLARRGFPNKVQRLHRLLYCKSPDTPQDARYKGHILLPDYDPKNPTKLRYWTTRASYPLPNKSIPKSYHLSAPKKHILFGEWLLPENNKSVIVVEGPLDAMALSGYAVALLGKEISDAQAMALASRFEIVTVCLDADAHKASIFAYKQLQGWGVNTRVCLLRNGDPADLLIRYGAEDALQFVQRHAKKMDTRKLMEVALA